MPRKTTRKAKAAKPKYEEVTVAFQQSDGNWVCMKCGAVVHHQYWREHAEWHAKLSSPYA